MGSTMKTSTLQHVSLLFCLSLAIGACAQSGGTATDPTGAQPNEVPASSDASDEADATDPSDTDPADGSETDDPSDATDDSDPTDGSDVSDAADSSDTPEPIDWTVNILAPSADTSFEVGQAISFRGETTADSVEYPTLTARWISDRDGVLFEGALEAMEPLLSIQAPSPMGTTSSACGLKLRMVKALAHPSKSEFAAGPRPRTLTKNLTLKIG